MYISTDTQVYRHVAISHPLARAVCISVCMNINIHLLAYNYFSLILQLFTR